MLHLRSVLVSTLRRPPRPLLLPYTTLFRSVAQQQADVDEPGEKDVYSVGTLATILQLLKLPDGTVKVLVEGVKRARLNALEIDDCFSAEIEELVESGESEEREMDVLTRSVVARFEQYVKLNKKIPPEILTSLSGIDS